MPKLPHLPEKTSYGTRIAGVAWTQDPLGPSEFIGGAVFSRTEVAGYNDLVLISSCTCVRKSARGFTPRSPRF